MQNYFFLILGMHRSGTSFLARCLNVSGVYLGEKMLLANRIPKANPKGFWENEYFTKLSDKLLKENKLNWDQITTNFKCSDSYKQQFKTIVNELVSESHFSSGVKDPRLLLLLHSIVDIFPENKIYVGIFRHPLKVAESLKIRDDFDYKKSLDLWQAYNSKLLEYIKNNNGFLFDFDWPKEKLLDEISMFVKKVGLFETDLNLVYSKDLFRSDKSFNNSYKIPTEIENTYQKLKEQSMQNKSISPKPITFSIDEAREIITKMMGTINKITEVKKEEVKEISLTRKIRKNQRHFLKNLRKLTR